MNRHSFPVALVLLALLVGYVLGGGLAPRPAAAGPMEYMNGGVILTDRCRDFSTELIAWRMSEGKCVGATRYALVSSDDGPVMSATSYAPPGGDPGAGILSHIIERTLQARG